MVMIRAFKGLRPKKSLVVQVAAFPYDVINSKEARVLAEGNPHSFLHVSKPEIDLPESVDVHDDRVYDKGRENFLKMIEQKIFEQDQSPHLYIYRQRMGNHQQYGLVGCTSVDEYNDNTIKKHEFTRKDKEDDRTRHTLTLNANSGPVFLTYKDNAEVDSIVADFVKSNEPEYDFAKEDEIQHTFWVVRDQHLVAKLTSIFDGIDNLYIADGHHRSASASRAHAERKKMAGANHKADAEYNSFLSVMFPASQLKILDYNRVVFDLNGNSKEQFLTKVKEKFEILVEGHDVSPSPKNRREFGMYLDGHWYQLKAKEGSFPANDPVEGLDVSILQNNLLRPILAIMDPRTDKRIDFVGGIRGSSELEKRVNSGEAKVAFKLYPPSIEQLMSVADSGMVMPPKSTWFEPKLRSGLVVHLLD